MVDYSSRATDINTQIQPSVRVVEPPSRQGEIDALQNIGKGVALGAKTVATYFQNNANLAQSKRLAKFDLDLLNLQNAESQGISAQEIRTRSRLLISQSIANDPNQEQEYLSRYSTWLNQSGYDKVANPAVQQYEVNQQVALTAVQNGFIAPGDFNDPVKVQAGIESFSNYQAEVRALEKEQKDLQLQSAKLELSSKQRAELKATREETAQTGLSRVASAAVPYWQAQYNDIVQAASKASTEQEKQTIVANGITRMKNDLALKKLQLSGSSLDLDQSKLDQVWKPIDNLVELYGKQLDGTIDTETFDRQSKALQSQAKLLTLQNLGPDGRQWAALSEISKNAADVLGPQITQRVIDMWSDNANVNSNSSEQSGNSPTARDEGQRPANLLYEKDSKKYLDGVTELIKRVNNGKYDEAVKGELDNQIQGILKGVDVFANANTSAKEFQPVIDFFANPIVGQYLATGGKVPTAVANATARVVADGYDQQVIPMLKDELGLSGALGTIRIGSQKGKPADFFEPTFETGRFSWRLKDGVPANFSSSTALRQLNNSSFVKVFNKMIMANSHLRGDVDYAKSYEQLAPLVFEEATSAGPDERSDATPNEDLNDLEDAPIEPASFTPASDNPDVDQEVMQRFRGRRVPVSIRNNNMGAISITGDIASSWAAKQPGFVGVSKRPANEGGYYAAFSTPEAGVAAASKLLQQYGESGTNTASKIVRKWSADKSAHNAYANTLVKFLNEAGYEVDSTTQLDLNDPNVRLAILKAKSSHESGAGKQVYSNAVFERGVLGDNV